MINKYIGLHLRVKCRGVLLSPQREKYAIIKYRHARHDGSVM